MKRRIALGLLPAAVAIGRSPAAAPARIRARRAPRPHARRHAATALGRHRPHHARHRPRRRPRPHALPVREGQGRRQQLLRRLREHLAAADRRKGRRRTGLRRRQARHHATHDGTTEITYAGHPLYTYAGDAKPGDVKGQGLDQFGAEWYVLAPSGRKIDSDS